MRGLTSEGSRADDPKERLMQRLDVALASMDIDSAVTADREGVVVINRRCPYVEQAAEGGVRPESVCEIALRGL